MLLLLGEFPLFRLIIISSYTNVLARVFLANYLIFPLPSFFPPKFIFTSPETRELFWRDFDPAMDVVVVVETASELECS